MQVLLQLLSEFLPILDFMKTMDVLSAEACLQFLPPAISHIKQNDGGLANTTTTNNRRNKKSSRHVRSSFLQSVLSHVTNSRCHPRVASSGRIAAV
ncbi:hypothetical protein MUK42_36900 [Musa troglodytarum]|uniref:Uncharacterized protein n=1 Tax=Musa troglodytarum TaxID=320322 RepID=A0A9E7GYL3_9LILI|nr:hypothetical protein MUK42_36900 [Musa troglodytarum]